MTAVNRLTEEQIEKLAVEVGQFLIDHEMWQDVAIYFNGKCFTTYDKEAGKYYYNDPDHLIVVENKDPNDYFDYVAEEHVLSMGFEGPLYALINYPQGTGDYRKLYKFNQIFKNYGLYYELGDAWNLSCYYV